MISFGFAVRLVISLGLALGGATLPIFGDVGKAVGGGALGSAFGFLITFVLSWVLVSKCIDFFGFAFGGGVGRYHTTKLYRRLQWVTFALFMTLPVFVLSVLFVSGTPVGEPSDRYVDKIARVEAQRLASARAVQRGLYDAAVNKRNGEIAFAQARRRANIDQAKRARLAKIREEEETQERSLEQTRDRRLSALDLGFQQVYEQFEQFRAKFPFSHRNNQDYVAEINAFADAVQRQFRVNLNSSHRKSLIDVVSDDLKGFERYYINPDCPTLIREQETDRMKRLRIYEMCTAFVLWLNFEANDLRGVTGQPLRVPTIRSMSIALRALPPLYERLEALEKRKKEIQQVFQRDLKAIDVAEPPVDETKFPLVDVSKFAEVTLSQFPLKVDQSPIEAEDPYFERITPTFERHWWWIAIAAFVLWLMIQSASQLWISKVYDRIMRFLDEGRFGFGGSARFTSMFEEWGKPYEKSKLYMGRSIYNPTDEVGLGGEAHMITVAGSRGGKGVSSIIPNLLLWEGSCVVVDPKGTNAHVTAQARRDMGHDVYLIDPFGIVTDESDRFDPFDGLDPQSELIRERIASIADALVIVDEHANDKHWDDGARTIIAGLISHIISGHADCDETLYSIRDLISKLPEEQDLMWAKMEALDSPGGYAKDAAIRYLRGSETNEVLGIMSNADKHTEWLSSDVMRRVTSKPTFKLTDLKKKPTTVYLIIPPRQLTKQNRLIRLFINLMLDVMEDGGRSDVPVLMMIDEFLALEKMPEIPTAFATMASYNLVLWLFIQDLAGLKSKYGDQFNAFIANSRAMQVFSTSDEETKKYVSERLGNRPLNDLGAIARSNENLPLRSPNDVETDLKASELRQYVIEAGSPAMLLERIPYFKTGTRFAGKYAPDPDFTR